MRYWINTVSRDHVRRGVEGGFTQANHGRAAGLRNAGNGDYIAFYSPRDEFQHGETVQSFTAIARVTDDAPYQETASTGAETWRRHVEYLPGTEAPIRPLLPDLGFIRNKESWGVVFRRGFFEIEAADFERIAGAMKVMIRR
jgi:EVE domain-containing protein